MTALSGEMDGVSDKIGNTDDTGGTTTAGSLMAKQNKSLTDLSSLVSNMSSVISKLSSGVTSKGIKRVQSWVQNCPYSNGSGTKNYWQTPFENDGIVIIALPSAGDGYGNSAKFIAVTDVAVTGGTKLDIGYSGYRSYIDNISKDGFYLISDGSSAHKSLLITHIEFN